MEELYFSETSALQYTSEMLRRRVQLVISVTQARSTPLITIKIPREKVGKGAGVLFKDVIPSLCSIETVVESHVVCILSCVCTTEHGTDFITGSFRGYHGLTRGPTLYDYCELSDGIL